MKKYVYSKGERELQQFEAQREIYRIVKVQKLKF